MVSEKRKGLYNLQNKDNECFRWCHIRRRNPIKIHPERITLKDREYVKKLDYSSVTFPVTVKDMDKIEKQNSININVFGWQDKGGAFPLEYQKRNSKII